MSLFYEELYSSLLSICYGANIYEKVLYVREITIKHSSASEKTFICRRLLENGLPPRSVAFYADVDIEYVKQIIKNTFLHYECDFDAPDPVLDEIKNRWEEKSHSFETST